MNGMDRLDLHAIREFGSDDCLALLAEFYRLDAKLDAVRSRAEQWKRGAETLSRPASSAAYRNAVEILNLLDEK